MNATTVLAMKLSGLSSVVGFIACASGPPLLLGQPIKKEVAILVRVSKDAAHTDELGGTAAIVERVTTGLSDRGVKNQLYAADDDHPGTPRIEIWVEKWDAGDRGDRSGASFALGMIGEALAAGQYDVISRIYREGDDKPTCEHRYKGAIMGTSESVSEDEGDSVGSSILRDSLRDQATCFAPSTSKGGGR